MKEVKQNQTLQELQMSSAQESSPDEIMKGEFEPSKTPRNSWTCNIKRCMFLIFLVISSTILIAEINASEANDDTTIVDNKAFQFYVYCPYSYRNNVEPIQRKNIDEDLRRRLYSQDSYNIELSNLKEDFPLDLNRTYVVEMQSRQNSAGNPQLFYCGLVTPYLSTCDLKVHKICSSPGPMFDLKTKQYADIIWINSLSKSYVPHDNSACINQTESIDGGYCTLMSKQNVTQTYPGPTGEHGDDGVRISPTNWPTSTHVHGAEVRPTFDGNPLSWINNAQQRGVGAYSLNDTCYYDAFDKNGEEHKSYSPPQVIVKKMVNGRLEIQNNYKINRYPNIQNPGNLWYHDHAMRLTRYNVQKGLSGLYILRDADVELQIGIHKTNERLVMMTTSGWITSSTLQSNADEVYRFRFLNNFFGPNSIITVQFVYGSCSQPKEHISFTIIGADSSLFNEGLYNENKFVLGPAERLELLIKFAENKGQYSICAKDLDGDLTTSRDHSNAEVADRKLNIENIRLNSRISAKQRLNNRTDISSVKLNVAFRNLTDQIFKPVVKRMRPLMLVNGSIRTINGRINFHDGRSENPTIGTTEDWYIISAVPNDHPIHVHLINFQVIRVLNLRVIQKTGSDPKVYCTLYELDFIAQAMRNDTKYENDGRYFQVIPISNLLYTDYHNLCNDKNILLSDDEVIQKLAYVNLQDEVDVNGVSGIDVEKKLNDTDKQFLQIQEIHVRDEIYKYILDDEDTSFKSYYRRWKDTALIEKQKVFVYRIRWTKSAYDEKKEEDPFFHVPIDQLREYPGFVYHCHILAHQDNEMMRPIMLQLPKEPKINHNTSCNEENPENDYSWEKKVKCINERCKNKQ